MAECNEIIIVIDNVPTIKTNTITARMTNAKNTASINCHGKKVRDCYILHAVLLVIMLLLVIIIVCYHYVKQKGIISNEK